MSTIFISIVERQCFGRAEIDVIISRPGKEKRYTMSPSSCKRLEQLFNSQFFVELNGDDGLSVWQTWIVEKEPKK